MSARQTQQTTDETMAEYSPGAFIEPDDQPGLFRDWSHFWQCARTWMIPALVIDGVLVALVWCVIAAGGGQ